MRKLVIASTLAAALLARASPALAQEVTAVSWDWGQTWYASNGGTYNSFEFNDFMFLTCGATAAVVMSAAYFADFTPTGLAVTTSACTLSMAWVVISYYFGMYNDYMMDMALRYYGNPWAWQWWVMSSGF
jgi:hypothetical protein